MLLQLGRAEAETILSGMARSSSTTTSAITTTASAPPTSPLFDGEAPTQADAALGGVRRAYRAWPQPGQAVEARSGDMKSGIVLSVPPAAAKETRPAISVMRSLHDMRSAPAQVRRCTPAAAPAPEAPRIQCCLQRTRGLLVSGRRSNSRFHPLHPERQVPDGTRRWLFEHLIPDAAATGLCRGRIHRPRPDRERRGTKPRAMSHLALPADAHRSRRAQVKERPLAPCLIAGTPLNTAIPAAHRLTREYAP